VRIHYYLDIDEGNRIKCRKCGHVICDAGENYKKHVPRAEVWPDEIPGQRQSKEDAMVIYYEYYCPGCYTMLDVELAEKGAAPLWDIQVKVRV